jgi:hypothetical protein
MTLDIIAKNIAEVIDDLYRDGAADRLFRGHAPARSGDLFARGIFRERVRRLDRRRLQ